MAKRKSKRGGKRRGAGRPRKLSASNDRKALLDALRDGCSLSDAATIAGCNYKTIGVERNRDKEFDAAVKQAEIEGKRILIKGAGQKKPDWLLAAKWPDEFARKDKYTLRHIVELYDGLLETAVHFVAEERQAAFREAMQAKLVKVAVSEGEVPDDGNAG